MELEKVVDGAHQPPFAGDRVESAAGEAPESKIALRFPKTGSTVTLRLA